MQDKIINFIIRHFKLLLAAVVLGLLVYVALQYSLVSVQVSGQSDKLALELRQQRKTTQKLRQGLNIVKTGHYTARATDADKMTEQAVQSQPLRINRVNMQLMAQKQTTKIAGNSLGCSFGNPTNLSATSSNSFTCTGRTKLFHHSFTDTPKRSEVQRDYVYGVVPYQDGVLALVNRPGGVNIGVDFINQAGRSATSFSVILNGGVENLSIIPAEPGQATDAGFYILNSQAKQLTHFVSRTDQHPQTISLSEPNDNDQTRYKVSAGHGKLYIITAKPQQDNSDDPEAIDSEVRLYHPSQLIKQAALTPPDDHGLAEVIPLDNNRLATGSLSGDIIIYQIEDQKLTIYDTIYQAGRPIGHHDQLIYSRDRDILSYQPSTKTSHLLYRYNKLLPSSIQLLGDKVVLGGAVEGPGLVHNFILVDKSPQPRELENILSYPGESNTTIYTDYNDSTIYIELNIENFTSDRASGQLIYDAEEVASKRTAIKQRLARDGIDENKYKIIITP